MKKIHVFFYVIFAILLSACGGSRKLQQSTNPIDEVEVTNPCQILAEEKPALRAWGDGVHSQMSTARRGAEANARANYRNAIETLIKTGYQNNADQLGKYVAAGQEGKGVTDETSGNSAFFTALAKGEIRNMICIKTSVYKMPDGRYHCYACVEYNGAIHDLMTDMLRPAENQALQNNISDGERAKIEEDFRKFRERMEKELNEWKR